MNSETIQAIKEISDPVVRQEDMFLVDVEVKHRKVPELWILVDSEHDGVDLDKCSRISRSIGVLIDEQNLLTGSYRLNVSSPGLSRPLSDIRQYRKNRGRTAKIKLNENGSYQTIEGVIEEVRENRITVRINKEQHRDIAFRDIVEAKIVPKF